MANSAGLCRNGKTYFSQNSLYSRFGRLDFTIYALYMVAELPADGLPLPSFENLLALALACPFSDPILSDDEDEDDDDYVPGEFEIEYLCAKPDAPKGVGKTLFDVVVQDAKSQHAEKFRLRPDPDHLTELVEMYQRKYGMACAMVKDSFWCELNMDSVPPAGVPLDVPFALSAAASAGGRSKRSVSKRSVSKRPVSKRRSLKRRVSKPRSKSKRRSSKRSIK